MTETEYVCPVGHVMADPTAPCEGCASLDKVAALYGAIRDRRREMWPGLRHHREYVALGRMERRVRRTIEADPVLRDYLPMDWSVRAIGRTVRSALRRRGSTSGRRA